MKSYLVSVRMNAGLYQDSVRRYTQTGDTPDEAARAAITRANREYPGSQPMVSAIQVAK